jgi:site-specific recombinase XerD
MTLICAGLLKLDWCFYETEELLGHENIRMTHRYTKVNNPALKKIRRPF